MDSETQFETYLFISPEKFIISVKEKLNPKEIFQIEKKIDGSLNEINTSLLDDFFKENIFKIEKTLKDFVKNINLIIDSKNFFNVRISVKKNNYGNLISLKDLEYILNEARDECSKTLKNYKTIHMLIDNYLIDKEKYSYLPKNYKCEHISLDVTFICLPFEFINLIEETVNRYHVSIERIISLKYVENFFQNEHFDLISMVEKINEGCNNNEVILTKKKSTNNGFFEKFFQFFT